MSKKVKRILAWIGIVLLLALYACTAICALIQSEFAKNLMWASLAMTFLIPVLIYAMELIYKALKRRDSKDGPSA